MPIRNFNQELSLLLLALLCSCISCSPLVAQETTAEENDKIKFEAVWVQPYINGIDLDEEQATSFRKLQNELRSKREEHAALQDALMTNEQRATFFELQFKNRVRQQELQKLSGDELIAKRKEHNAQRQSELQTFFTEDQLSKFRASQKTIDVFYEQRNVQLKELLLESQFKSYSRITNQMQNKGTTKGKRINELTKEFFAELDLSEENRKKFMEIEGQGSRAWKEAKQMSTKEGKAHIAKTQKSRVADLKELLSQPQMNAYWKFRRGKDAINQEK